MLTKISFKLACDQSAVKDFNESSDAKIFGYKISGNKISLLSPSLGSSLLRFYQLSEGLSILTSEHTFTNSVQLIKEGSASEEMIMVFDLSIPGNEYTVRDSGNVISAGELANHVVTFSNAMNFTIVPPINKPNRRLWIIIDKKWFIRKTKFISSNAYNEVKDFFKFDHFFNKSTLTLSEVESAKKIIEYPFDSIPETAAYFDLNAYTDELLSSYLKDKLSVDQGFDFSINMDELNTLLEMRTYVRENILSETSISMVSLCQQFHLTESTFQRNFKKYFGVTFNAFYNLERLKKAYEILREKNNLSIKDVAHSLGYKSVPYFSKRFRNAFDIYPSDLKNL